MAAMQMGGENISVKTTGRYTGIPAPFFMKSSVPVLLDNVDTNLIAPGKVPGHPKPSEDQLGFAYIRYLADGSDNPDFILNMDRYRKASILVVGQNFGTGSTRSTAATNPLAMGIRVVIGKTFGPNFFGNAVNRHLWAVRLNSEVIDKLAAWVVAHPATAISVDMQKSVVEVPGWDPLPLTIEPRIRNKWANGLSDIEEVEEHAAEGRKFQDENRKQQPWIYDMGEGQR